MPRGICPTPELKTGGLPGRLSCSKSIPLKARDTGRLTQRFCRDADRTPTRKQKNLFAFFQKRAFDRGVGPGVSAI